MNPRSWISPFFFFNDTATTEIYTLSLHDALPISWRLLPTDFPPWGTIYRWFATFRDDGRFEAINHTDRKSTRLNSSHQIISYAVFCLKKKKKTYRQSSRCKICCCLPRCFPFYPPH